MSVILKMCYSLTIILIYYLGLGCVGYDPEASITGLYTGPYFDPLAPRNLTAHLEDRAVLPCTVRQLGDKSVSWVRLRDADILTVDRYTFVSDERFEAHYTPTYETWNLIIKYVQERDAGMYECQVSTEPKMSQLFNLRVVVPRVSMVPPGDRYVKAGSKVKIDCHITDVVQQPDYIFWYHDAIRVLEQRDSNIEVNVKKTGEESLMSTLTISRVRRDESGNYTCMPSNLHSASVLLHVLNEEHPEAMKDGRNASGKMEQPIFLLLLFILSTAVGRLFTDYSLPKNKEKKRGAVSGSARNQSDSISAEKNNKEMILNISKPQNRCILFRSSRILLECSGSKLADVNLSLRVNKFLLLHQNEQTDAHLLKEFETESLSEKADNPFVGKFISRQDTIELNGKGLRVGGSRADESEKLIERTHPPTENHRKSTVEEPKSESLNIKRKHKYNELSILDSGKWITIHSIEGKDFDKDLNKFQDFVDFINIFPYNQGFQGFQEVGSITFR